MLSTSHGNPGQWQGKWCLPATPSWIQDGIINGRFGDWPKPYYLLLRDKNYERKCLARLMSLTIETMKHGKKNKKTKQGHKRNISILLEYSNGFIERFFHTSSRQGCETDLNLNSSVTCRCCCEGQLTLKSLLKGRARGIGLTNHVCSDCVHTNHLSLSLSVLNLCFSQACWHFPNSV